MIVQGIHIPEELIKSFTEGKVVVFAGAGVSMLAPSNCPSFDKLADRIAEGTGLNRESTPIDQFLGCHRVVNAQGKLARSYAFGGVAAQRRLLVSEGVVFKNNQVCFH